MKLYVSCDMEGTAGVCAWRQCDPSDAFEYPAYRRYMTQEVRAAIDGAREAGADGILINDSHWDMRNLVWDELPQDGGVRVITGSRKPWSMGQGLDGTFAGAFFTGYHAKAGDAATLSHTFSPETIYDVRVNGRSCSEALLMAALAGSHGVPLLMITGDRRAVEEVTAVMPWCVGVVVKEVVGYSAVNSLTPHAARAAIRDGAREATSRIEKARPFTFAPPFELLVETVNVENADFIELMPGFVRAGARAVTFAAESYPALMNAFVVATRLGSAANAP